VTHYSDGLLDERDYPRLVRHVTASRVKAHFADLADGDVTRYAPLIGALNFVFAPFD